MGTMPSPAPVTRPSGATVNSKDLRHLQLLCGPPRWKDRVAWAEAFETPATHHVRHSEASEREGDGVGRGGHRQHEGQGTGKGAGEHDVERVDADGLRLEGEAVGQSWSQPPSQRGRLDPLILLPSLRTNPHPHPNTHSGHEPPTSARGHWVTWAGPLGLSGGDKCAALPSGAWEGEELIKRISKVLRVPSSKAAGTRLGNQGLGTLREAISRRHLRNDRNRSWARDVGWGHQ